jgi:NADH-quinone oxidoreductase subunit G
VLGNVLNLSGFEYVSSEEVRDELKRLVGEPAAATYQGNHRVSRTASTEGVVDLPMYHVDAIVRRAPSLQRTHEGRAAAVTY